jgi:hypothetical protein
MKIIKIKDISNTRLLSKEKVLRKLALKKGYNLISYDNFFRCIFLTSNSKGFQLTITENVQEKRKVILNNVNYTNKCFFIEL